ncbi:serine/threonine protein kinase [Larkinella ripae]
MDSSHHTVFNASDRSYLAILKKEIRSYAAQIEFNAHKLAELDIIVAEIASNLVKHAGGGEVLVRKIQEKEQTGIELISIDNGPGINDPIRMLEDGMSTTQTLGQGLGAIKRLSDYFQLYSLKKWGTILLSRVYTKDPPAFRALQKVEIRPVIVPKPGETACGDGFFAKTTPTGLKLFLGDGLGHGPEASHAVQEAIRAFQLCPEPNPASIIRSIHQAVKKTRGLVGTVVTFDYKTRCWKLCGVGNIATRLQSGILSKNHMAYNGIIGLNIPGTMNDQEVAFESGQQLIMCSDGIKSRWDLSKYPAIAKYDLSILAAALYKDYARRTDDTSVVVARIG